jgi:hypothetical protein
LQTGLRREVILSGVEWSKSGNDSEDQFNELIAKTIHFWSPAGATANSIPDVPDH